MERSDLKKGIQKKPQAGEIRDHPRFPAEAIRLDRPHSNTRRFRPLEPRQGYNSDRLGGLCRRHTS